MRAAASDDAAARPPRRRFYCWLCLPPNWMRPHYPPTLRLHLRALRLTLHHAAAAAADGDADIGCQTAAADDDAGRRTLRCWCAGNSPGSLGASGAHRQAPRFVRQR